MSYYCGYFCALQILYDLFGESKNNDKNLFFFVFLLGRKKTILFYTTRLPKRGILHNWIANRLYVEIVQLSLHRFVSQPTNQTKPSRKGIIHSHSFKIKLNNLFKHLQTNSLSLTCRKLSGNILSISSQSLSLSFCSILSNSHISSPIKGRQLHDFTLIFLDFFLLFFILFLTSVGFYALLDFISFN